MSVDAAAVPSRSRISWLDLYRGAAVLLMVEAHVFNSFLAPAFRASEWFAKLNYVNGLVAPAFLFIAGYAQGLRWRRAPVTAERLGPRLKHLGGIAAIGLALHFPWAELRAAHWAEALAMGLRIDILPCLAVSIAALLLVESCVGKRAPAVMAALALALVALAPAAANWTTAPVPVLAWLNHTTGSLFPLLPWAAFAFCGYTAAACLPRVSHLAIAAVACVAAEFAVGRVALGAASPAFFLERLAWILLAAPVCAVVSRLEWRAVLYAGRESLCLYVAHLLVISALLGIGVGALPPSLCLVMLAALLLVSFAIARGWRELSVWSVDRVRRAMRRLESSAPAA